MSTFTSQEHRRCFPYFLRLVLRQSRALTLPKQPACNGPVPYDLGHNFPLANTPSSKNLARIYAWEYFASCFGEIVHSLCTGVNSLLQFPLLFSSQVEFG